MGRVSGRALGSLGSGRAGAYFSRKAIGVGPSDADLGLRGATVCTCSRKGHSECRHSSGRKRAVAAWEGMDLDRVAHGNGGELRGPSGLSCVDGQRLGEEAFTSEFL